ncbi:MAG: hypothetical protein ACRCZI_00435 [Cetobacterium sp.]
MGVEKVIEGEHWVELAVFKEFIPDSLAGDAVEHVVEVQQEKGAGRGGAGHMLVELGAGEVYHELETAFEGNAKLAMGEEVIGKGRAMLFHDVLASDATEGGANGDGPKLGGVRGIFVEGHEMAGREHGNDGGRDLVVEKEGEELGEPLEVGK